MDVLNRGRRQMLADTENRRRRIEKLVWRVSKVDAASLSRFRTEPGKDK